MRTCDSLSLSSKNNTTIRRQSSELQLFHFEKLVIKTDRTLNTECLGIKHFCSPQSPFSLFKRNKTLFVVGTGRRYRRYKPIKNIFCSVFNLKKPILSFPLDQKRGKCSVLMDFTLRTVSDIIKNIYSL